MSPVADPTPVPPPPGPRAPAVAQMARMFRDPVGYLERCRRDLGPVFRIDYPGSPPFVFVAEAGLAADLYARDRDVGRAGEAREPFLAPVVGRSSILCVEDETWRRQRRLVSAPLHGRRVSGWRDRIAALAEAEVARWPRGKPFAAHPRLRGLTLEVIMQVVFGIDDVARLERLRVLLPRLLDAASLVLLVPELRRVLGRRHLRRLPGNPMGRLLDARTRVDRLLFAEIAHRRGSGEAALGERGDLLSTLLLARDEADEPMTDGELRDELMTVLVAGHETTATGLAWALERLVRHPDVLRRLRTSLADGDRSYLDAVVKETLRVRPVVFDTPRLLTAPLELGGWRVPSGWLVSCALPSVHLDAGTFDRPAAYAPERFLATDAPTTSWMPFGGGRRRCVGSRLALLEMQAVLEVVVGRCELGAPDPRDERQRPSGVTLRPGRGARIVVR